jgi:hypothetical protein
LVRNNGNVRGAKGFHSLVDGTLLRQIVIFFRPDGAPKYRSHRG